MPVKMTFIKIIQDNRYYLVEENPCILLVGIYIGIVILEN